MLAQGIRARKGEGRKWKLRHKPEQGGGIQGGPESEKDQMQLSKILVYLQKTTIIKKNDTITM